MFSWFRSTPKVLDEQAQAQLLPSLITIEGLGNVPWQTGHSLLNTLEQAGLPVRHSCRKGNCGACIAEVIEGKVGYLHPVSFESEAQTILLCAAVPIGNLTLRLGAKVLKRS
jgi:ferredoxin